MCRARAGQVERAWANYKLANNITAKNSDYETRYREMLQSQFPAQWSSFRHYEATRQVHNILGKLGCLPQMKAYVSEHCDFLHNELAHDSVMFVFKEVLTALPAVFNIMSEQEKQCMTLELLYMGVLWPQCSFHMSMTQ